MKEVITFSIPKRIKRACSLFKYQTKLIRVIFIKNCAVISICYYSSSLSPSLPLPPFYLSFSSLLSFLFLLFPSLFFLPVSQGKGSDQITKFKSWFWSIVERMSNRERQDLLYFWTSSPVMPANPETYQPAPSITLRPADDQHLPTSNTCISRLYLPLYSSKALLKAKLLAAIKIKTFGFI